MMPLIKASTGHLVEYIENVGDGGKPIDMKDTMNKYSLHNIASCVFGVDADTFRNEKSRFTQCAQTMFIRSTLDIMKLMGTMIPGIRHLLFLFRVPIFKPTETEFFMSVVEQTLKHRRNAPSSDRRNDLIDMLVDALEDKLEQDEEGQEVKRAKKSDELTVTSTALNLLVAGYDTTSGILFESKL